MGQHSKAISATSWSACSPDGLEITADVRHSSSPSLSPSTHADWSKLYGKTFRFHGFGKVWKKPHHVEPFIDLGSQHDYRLLSLDLRVISHVINSPVYGKPWQTRSFLSKLLGRGLLKLCCTVYRPSRRTYFRGFCNGGCRT